MKIKDFAREEQEKLAAFQIEEAEYLKERKWLGRPGKAIMKTIILVKTGSILPLKSRLEVIFK